MTGNREVGQFSERLRLIEAQEKQRRDAIAKKLALESEFAAAVETYIQRRLPNAGLTETEQKSYVATLRWNAEQLLSDNPPPMKDIWGAYGFTPDEFCRTRRALLEELTLLAEINHRLSTLKHCWLRLGGWDEYIDALRKHVLPTHIDNILARDTRSIPRIQSAIMLLQDENEALNLKYNLARLPGYRQGAMDGGARQLSLDEWLHPESWPRRPGHTPSSVKGGANESPTTSSTRHYRIRGLSAEDTIKRLKDVLKRSRSGSRSIDIGLAYDCPDSTVRTWLKVAQRLEREGQL